MRPIPEAKEKCRERDDARREELLEESRLALDKGGAMSGHGWRAHSPVPDHVLDLEARLARLDLRMAELWVAVAGLTATVAELHAAVQETTKREGAECGCAQRGDQPRVSAPAGSAGPVRACADTAQGDQGPFSPDAAGQPPARSFHPPPRPWPSHHRPQPPRAGSSSATWTG